MNKKFNSTMRKGFHMTFANGLTASVQWGAGNYCDNHFPEDCLSCDTVCGYMTPEQVVDFLYAVKNA